MAPDEIDVEVVHARGPHDVLRRNLRLPAGATAADALRGGGLFDVWAAEAPRGLQLGCWGKPCTPETVLRDLDRVELYRPLQVDPMQARRLREQRDGRPKQKRR